MPREKQESPILEREFIVWRNPDTGRMGVEQDTTEVPEGCKRLMWVDHEDEGQ